MCEEDGGKGVGLEVIINGREFADVIADWIECEFLTKSTSFLA